MNMNPPDTTAKLGAELRNAALDLLDAIETALAEAAMLRHRLQRLAGRTCTGAEHWRDADSSSPKLYVNHGIDEACPLHGTPEPGTRIRTYVGTKPSRQKRARAAMHAETMRRAYEQRLAAINSTLNTSHRLQQITRALREHY